MPGPLNGYRILDITTIVLGPYGTQILGDMGADIIKVEAPPGGDIFRHAGEGRNSGMSGPFLNMNRNKRSICLDLKKGMGREALTKLIKSADVLVHNMRTKAIKVLGFDYDKVKLIKPEIIYCACGGFSENGPYAGKPAYDDLIQALSGLCDLSKDASNGEPRFAPTVLVDKLTGLTMSQAITSGLLHRERTGQGQFIEVPMFETMVSFLMAEHIFGHAFSPPEGPLGYSRLTTPNRKPNRSKNGWITVLPYTDKQWRDFFELSGNSTFNHDSRFETPFDRAKNVHDLYGLLSEILKKRTTEEWLTICEKAEIPAAPVLTLADLFIDPHLQAVGMFEKHTHPTEGDTVITKPPVEFSMSPSTIRRQAPRLGEQSEEILIEVGYDQVSIDELKKHKIFLDPTL